MENVGIGAVAKQLQRHGAGWNGTIWVRTILGQRFPGHDRLISERDVQEDRGIESWNDIRNNLCAAKQLSDILYRLCCGDLVDKGQKGEDNKGFKSHGEWFVRFIILYMVP